MVYCFLADIVVLFHLVFIVFALLGGLLALWRIWAVFLHLPTAIWASIIEFTKWVCPLTPLENRLREAGGSKGYEGGFIEHYLISVVYPSGLTQEIQFLLGAVAVAVNLGVYSIVIHRLLGRGKGA